MLISAFTGRWRPLSIIYEKCAARSAAPCCNYTAGEGEGEGAPSETDLSLSYALIFMLIVGILLHIADCLEGINMSLRIILIYVSFHSL